MKSGKQTIVLAAIVMTTVSALANTVSIVSPDHAETFAYGSMISHDLHANGKAGELTARITFSNFPYYGGDQPRQDEMFDFHFAGIQLDRARGTLFVRSKHSGVIPVARFHKGLVFRWIDLAPGAKIYLLKEHGRVTAVLTATSHPRAGSRWVQMDNNFSLQNILIALFGGFPASIDT
jgi:hypothetical protein